MTKSPKVSYEEKKAFLGIEAEGWIVTYALEKYGDETYCAWCKAKVSKWTSGEIKRHIEAHDWSDKAVRKDTLEALERGMSLNFGKGNFMDKEANKVDCRNCYIKAFNDYHRKLLSLISGMKGGKE